VAQTLASHNLLTNRAREMIKPSTDSASLQLEIEKKKSWLGFRVLCVLRHNESMFGFFLEPLPGPGHQANTKFFRAKFFWICDSKTSLQSP